ncbi:hypothetical protein BFF78_00725 [Streptomyces fodineus]|uniref:Uncharacterized protein n=1 Tax=Streptomyces fodineus TaxID=1904616 RepID=A0A1D7Y2L7_9ACTN|nr:hypothetical protein BFF78_00725 [Streptomyces fodineus]
MAFFLALLALLAAVIIVRSLIRRAWSTHRWHTCPSTVGRMVSTLLGGTVREAQVLFFADADADADADAEAEAEAREWATAGSTPAPIRPCPPVVRRTSRL